jgi:ABC-2 type transport system ATP-binding protein
MSIEIKNLTRLYGTQKAVDNISFHVNKGQVVGFIGPNGAGKSTTMKIITGYLPPTEGEALVNGLNTREESMEVRKIIGYLPEHNPLYTEMYVREYLNYVTGLYAKQPGMKNPEKKINEAIELTGLGPESHKKISALSKGYRQRVGLAQAIIHKPEVLILDEPTSGLDPSQVVGIRNLISELGKEKTVLLSTHLMQEVEAICDRVILINKGKIVADGKPGEIKTETQADSVTLILEFNKIPSLDKLQGIEGVLIVKELDNNLILLEAKSTPDPRQLIFDFAVENELKVLSMQRKEKSLEEVFRELTG